MVFFTFCFSYYLIFSFVCWCIIDGGNDKEVSGDDNDNNEKKLYNKISFLKKQ